MTKKKYRFYISISKIKLLFVSVGEFLFDFSLPAKHWLLHALVTFPLLLGCTLFS